MKRTLPLPVLQEGAETLTRVSGIPMLDTLKSPPSMLPAVLLSVVLLGALLAITQIANYQEIRRNWSHYRCDPSVAPFSKFYGYDLQENMNFCIGQQVKEHAGGVITPLYKGIEEVSDVIDDVYSKAEAIEGGVSGLLKGFESFLVNFANSFRLIGVRIQMSVVRIREIFDRIFGIFVAFAYAAISAITFGENIVCNPLVTFIGRIAGVDICCFPAGTEVVLENGIRVPIEEVQISDSLWGGAEVTSTYRFDGSTTPMVRIDNVVVSGNHWLYDDATGVPHRADEDPRAVSAESVQDLWCLGTSTNRLPIWNAGRITWFTDYEECSDPAVIAEAQAVAERELNGGNPGPTVADYSLGLDPQLMVLLSSGRWRRLMNVKVGDVLAGDGVVNGLVFEECEHVCKSPAGHLVSGAQLILHNWKWVRAANVWPRVTSERPWILKQLIMSNNKMIQCAGRGEMFSVRDYKESPGTQTVYDRALVRL